MTNRHQRRAQASAARQHRSNVSATLLQKQFDELAKQAHQMRNVLFGIVKEQGRVRVQRATIDGLEEVDGLEANWQGDTLVIEFRAGKHIPPEEAG